MWVVRKKSPDTNNKYQTIYRSMNKEDALGVFKAEYRLLLESNPSLDRQRIDNLVGYCYNAYNTYSTASNGDTSFRFFESFSDVENVPLTRPSRTDILNQILSSKTLCLRED